MVGTRPLGRDAGRPGRGEPGRAAVDRQQHRQGTPLGSGRKRGADRQAIGRSRGGRGTKIHRVANGAGRVLAVTVAPGQMGDVRVAHGLLASLPAPNWLFADTAYDSDGLRRFLIERGTMPVIPNNPTRKHPPPFDRQAHKARNIIERTIGRLKDWRRITPDMTNWPPTSPQPSPSPPSSSNGPD